MNAITTPFGAEATIHGQGGSLIESTGISYYAAFRTRDIIAVAHEEITSEWWENVLPHLDPPMFHRSFSTRFPVEIRVLPNDGWSRCAISACSK